MYSIDCPYLAKNRFYLLNIGFLRKESIVSEFLHTKRLFGFPESRIFKVLYDQQHKAESGIFKVLYDQQDKAESGLFKLSSRTSWFIFLVDLPQHQSPESR